MQAGKLDRRIIIRRAVRTIDAMNSQVETFVDFITVWAAVWFVSDGERAKSGQLNASRIVRFQIRYSSAAATVNPKDRIVFDGRIYDIIADKEIGLREGIELTAATRMDGG
jgi:SPP1 family predicted phage head-tail adaptor